MPSGFFAGGVAQGFAAGQDRNIRRGALELEQRKAGAAAQSALAKQIQDSIAEGDKARDQLFKDFSSAVANGLPQEEALKAMTELNDIISLREANIYETVAAGAAQAGQPAPKGVGRALIQLRRDQLQQRAKLVPTPQQTSQAAGAAAAGTKVAEAEALGAQPGVTRDQALEVAGVIPPPPPPNKLTFTTMATPGGAPFEAVRDPVTGITVRVDNATGRASPVPNNAVEVKLSATGGTPGDVLDPRTNAQKGKVTTEFDNQSVMMSRSASIMDRILTTLDKTPAANTAVAGAARISGNLKAEFMALLKVTNMTSLLDQSFKAGTLSFDALSPNKVPEDVWGPVLANESAGLKSDILMLALATAGMNGQGEGKSLSDRDIRIAIEQVGGSAADPDQIRARMLSNATTMRDTHQAIARVQRERNPGMTFNPDVPEMDRVITRLQGNKAPGVQAGPVDDADVATLVAMPQEQWEALAGTLPDMTEAQMDAFAEANRLREARRSNLGRPK